LINRQLQGKLPVSYHTHTHYTRTHTSAGTVHWQQLPANKKRKEAEKAMEKCLANFCYVTLAANVLALSFKLF